MTIGNIVMSKNYETSTEIILHTNDKMLTNIIMHC